MPKIAPPCDAKTESQQGPDVAKQAKPTELASVSLLLGQFTDKAPKTPSTPLYDKSRCRAQELPGPPSASARGPPPVGKEWKPKPGSEKPGSEDQGTALRLRFLRARVPPGWGLEGVKPGEQWNQSSGRRAGSGSRVCKSEVRRSRGGNPG